MPRSHYRGTVLNDEGQPVDGASIRVFDLDTVTPISETIYVSHTGGATRTNPFLSDALGDFDFYLDDSARLSLYITKTGLTPRTITIDMEDDPAYYATDADLDSHVADAADAHDASAVSFIPVGSLSATDVQAAIAEVSGDVTTIGSTYLPLAGGTMTGAILFSPDNAYDVGASGATRPRTVYAGTSVVAPFVSLGGTLTGTGEVRLPWGGSIMGRNLANSADERIIGYDLTATSRIIVGANEVRIPSTLDFVTDNASDVGRLAANRPRTAYVGTSLMVGSAGGFLSTETVYNVSGRLRNGNMMLWDSDFTSTSSGKGFWTDGTTVGINNWNGPISIWTGTAGLPTWKWSTAGHFLAHTDNTYDIGASGATRPRVVYAGTSVITPLLVAGDGTAANPSMIFSSSLTTGYYRAAAGEIGVSLAGAAAGLWYGNGLIVGSATKNPAELGLPTIKLGNTNIYASASGAALLCFSNGYYDVADGWHRVNLNDGMAIVQVDSAKGGLYSSAASGAANSLAPNTIVFAWAGNPGTIGYFGHALAGQQTVTGSRGGSAALADLLTKLAAYGLIVDSTSA